MPTSPEPTFTASARANRQHAVSHIVSMSMMDTARVSFQLLSPVFNELPNKMARATSVAMRTADVMEQIPGLLRAYDHFMTLPYHLTNTALASAVSWWVANADAIRSVAHGARGRDCTLDVLQSVVWDQCAPTADVPYPLPLASEHDCAYDVRSALQIGMPQYFKSRDPNHLVRAVTTIHQWPGSPSRGVTNVYVSDDLLDSQFPGLIYAQGTLTRQGVDPTAATKKAIVWWVANAPAIRHLAVTGSTLGLEGDALHQHIWEATLPGEVAASEHLELPDLGESLHIDGI